MYTFERWLQLVLKFVLNMRMYRILLRKDALLLAFICFGTFLIHKMYNYGVGYIQQNNELTYIANTKSDSIKTQRLAEWMYNAHTSIIDTSCPTQMQTFGVGSGEKKLCLSKPYSLARGCLIYSFGISHDWSFDKDMAELFQCEVFSFDPSNGWEDGDLMPNVHFYSIGLANFDSDYYKAPWSIYNKKVKQIWKMRTLESIVKIFNHTDRVIDVLKIDIEGYEFEVLNHTLQNSIILDQVKQIDIEFHIFGSEKRVNIADYLHVILCLKMAGFQSVRAIRYYSTKCKQGYCNQCNMTFINTAFNVTSRYPQKN